MISVKILKKFIFLTTIFVVMVVINLMNIKVDVAYASMNSLSFGPNGLTVGTFLQAGDNIATFQISPAVTADNYMICMNFPNGSDINTENMAATDFIVEQDGSVVGPASLNLGWAPVICLQMLLTALDADSPITLRLSDSSDGATYASGDEIQLPTTATSNGNFSIIAAYLGSELSLSNVSLIPDDPTQILVETEADGTGTVVPEQTLWIEEPLTVYANTRDQYDNFIENVAATWSLQGKTGGIVNGDLVPNGDNKNAVFAGSDEGTVIIRAISGGLTAIDSETITVVEEFCGDGNGTTSSPYGICDWNNLNNVRNHLDAHFILMNDLDESTDGYAIYASSTANAGAGWLPIGNNSVKFSGSFDGNEFSISNLYINRLSEDYIGLFGYITDSVILDLGLKDENITGRDYVGGLVGYSNYGSISNSYSTGSISASDDYVGGLVGYSNYGSISNSYSASSVSGSVSFSDRVGGLVGHNNTSISNSYSTGAVSGAWYVGGLVGLNYGPISKSYSVGSVFASVSYVGGLVSYNFGSINYSFWDIDTSGQETSAGGTGKTTAEMKTESTFTDASWDFSGVWTINDTDNDGYPALAWQVFEDEEPPVNFRKNVYINNSNSSILTDYQVRLDFNSSTFDFANASSTGADIYFTDESETVLSHWIKNFSTTGTSTIWIKVPSLAASGTTMIYMNYGDLSVDTTYSNASSTFIFYDGFDDGSIADWTTSTESLEIENDEVATSSASSTKYISPIFSACLYSYTSCFTLPFNGSYSIISKTLDLASSTYAIDFNVFRQITNSRVNYLVGVQSSIRINDNVVIYSEGITCTGINCTRDSGWLEKSIGFNSSMSKLGLVHSSGDCAYGNTFYDDVRIRKSASVEPTALFEMVTVSYIAGLGGSITGNTTQSVSIGSNASSVTATPSTGYTFVDWSDGLTSTSRTDTNITTNTSYMANFTTSTYVLEYIAGAEGTITGSSTQSIFHGEDGVEVTAVPVVGYTFVDWSDGLTSTSRIDTNITTNTSYTANFITSTYVLEYIAGAGGTITGSSTQSIFHGEDGVEVTAVPSTGYSFVDWSDGLTSTSRTDTNITTNTSYTANFLINSHTLNYLANIGGTINGSSTQNIDYGSDGSEVTAVPSTGYSFVDWSDGLTSTSRIDTGIVTNTSYTANFRVNQISNGFMSYSVPLVVVPPAFSDNSTLNSSVTNVYQMAISDSEDFSKSVWEPYNENYKINKKILYIKFRSREGGVSKIFVINSGDENDSESSKEKNNYEGKLVKYANSPKIYKIENNQRRWIIDELAFNYYNFSWQDISIIETEFIDGENIVKPTVDFAKFIFTRDLKLGFFGDDVKALQQYLNNNGFVLVASGIGSKGNETNYFGSLTQEALIRFQKANNINPALGYFGSLTRASMNK